MTEQVLLVCEDVHIFKTTPDQASPQTLEQRNCG